MPEPQTLLSVAHAVELSSPAPSTAWRAGAWPTAAGNTQPMMASLMSFDSRPDWATVALIATAASCGEESDTNCPFMPPMGVRFAPTITIESIMMRSRLRQNHDFAFDFAIGQPLHSRGCIAQRDALANQRFDFAFGDPLNQLLEVARMSRRVVTRPVPPVHADDRALTQQREV